MIGFTQNSQYIEVSKQITLKSEAGLAILPICGAIYCSGNFVSRIISLIGEVWYHNSIETKCQCICKGHLLISDFSENDLKCHESKSKYTQFRYVELSK